MSNAVPTIRLRSFLQMAPYLAMRGVSSLEFLRRLGISSDFFQNPDIWLPQTACFRIGNEMADITQDPFGGAYVGFLTEIRSLGAWGESILGSENIAQACAMAASNSALLHQGGKVKIVTEGRTTKLIHQFRGPCEADPKHFILGSLAVLRKIPLMSGEPSAIRVHIKMPRARGDDALEECLGQNLETSAEYNMIEFDRDLLDSPLQHTRDNARKITEAIRSTLETANTLITRISDRDQSKLATISRSVGLSPRTLQRRLNYCGVDFDALRDETRRLEALQLISRGNYSATEIAYMVGYSDQAHFTRAFKRWTGSIPSRYRFTS
ncbi:AraC family transcriptional regulator [Pandoraea sp. SD6-2]|uniref:AraC family transcriptional regulator n=1 Tax=Pandoraea sp. SD6-2 TaxID=1286093 RepID=UPI0003AAC1A1|nr:AraC family transcriptional regulator [Pandoraea sp. SD6-2]